jgi:short-chain Z-isoprenyl diphosphate synthase
MTAVTIESRLLPRHVGMVMDGNRRWAKKAGFSNPGAGHDVGADHVADLLGWCTQWGIDHLTSYVLSADNIRKRPKSQVDHLFGILAEKLPQTVVRSDRWALHVSGDLSLLPDDAAEALRAAERETADRPAHLTMAIGYDPHGDIVEGIRRAIAAGVTEIDEQAITAALPGGPIKEIDLVIRTSGEQRLSGFFPWQTSNAEIVVSEKLWPDFTDADFAEALRLYAAGRSSDAAG